MAKPSKVGQPTRPEPTIKCTSIGRGMLKTSSMNKSKRRSFKKYRGQGRQLWQSTVGLIPETRNATSTRINTQIEQNQISTSALAALMKMKHFMKSTGQKSFLIYINVKLELYHEPLKNLPYLFPADENEVDWKGTIGVGDILFGLNAVHMMVHLMRKRREVPYVTMNVYWEHDEQYLHHFEDPETIIERAEYIHNFYYDKDAVRMNHILNSTDTEITSLRHRGFQRLRSPLAVLDGLPSWVFRKDIWCEPVENKVVFWRPLFNKDIPRGWKRTYSNDDWERIIQILKRKGFNPVELTYRTPVREAMYHIRTCRFCIFYDGMWQYIAKNLCKPVIALGDSGILETHNPQGVHFFKPDDPKRDLFDYLNKLPYILKHTDRRANRYKDFILRELSYED